MAFEPGLVTRSDHDDVAAGAVVWAVAKGNDLVGTGRPLRRQRHPGRLRPAVDAVEPRQRRSRTPVGRRRAALPGRPLWMFNANPDVIPLGSPDLLLSRFRQRVALLRDLALQLRARTPTG